MDGNEGQGGEQQVEAVFVENAPVLPAQPRITANALPLFGTAQLVKGNGGIDGRLIGGRAVVLQVAVVHVFVVPCQLDGRADGLMLF